MIDNQKMLCFTLIHFSPMFHFHTPSKHQKTKDSQGAQNWKIVLNWVNFHNTLNSKQKNRAQKFSILLYYLYYIKIILITSENTTKTTVI